VQKSAFLRTFLHFFECEFVSVGVDFYFVTVGEFAGQKLGGKRVLQSLLNRPLQRPCTKDGVVAFVHNQLPGVVGEFNPNLARTQTPTEVIELDVDNLS